MKFQELALEVPNNLFALFISLFFVRIVKMVSPYNQSTFLILGIPPWRSLEVKDCYTKKVYRVT